MTSPQRRRLNQERVGQLLPAVRAKALELLNAAETRGMPLLITGAYRSPEEQARLYAQGRTAPGKRVTNAQPGQSWHNHRAAFDVVFLREGVADWRGPWEHLGQLGQSLGLIWGGAFVGLVDRPHFEYHPGLQLKSARTNSTAWQAFARQGVGPTYPQPSGPSPICTLRSAIA